MLGFVSIYPKHSAAPFRPGSRYSLASEGAADQYPDQGRGRLFALRKGERTGLIRRIRFRPDNPG